MSMLLITTTLAWSVPKSPTPLPSRRDFFGTAMIATTFLVVAPIKVNAVDLLDDLTMPTASATEADTVRVLFARDVGMVNS